MRTLTTQFITELVERAVRGEMTSDEVAEKVLQKLEEPPSSPGEGLGSATKTRSNQRLKDLCAELQEETDPGTLRQIKDRLRQEFYDGDRIPSCQE